MTYAEADCAANALTWCIIAFFGTAAALSARR